MRVAALVSIAFVVFALLPVRDSFAQSSAGGAQIRVGADVLLAEAGSFEGKRIGLVTHRAGVTSDGVPTMSAIGRIEGLKLGALFAPEHGLDGSYDSSEPVPNAVSRGIPVYSLHGGTFSPTRQMLSRVDTLVVDLQDAGVRPFTYASTMALVMRAAADSGKPVIILDRPNPLGGLTVDGPVLEDQFQSFIGMYPIPYVHGMTLGELAALYNRAFGINAKLTVIPMQGWERRMVWSDTGLPWANPSPGLVDADIAPYYAATGPFDGTNIWNGVATDSRFRVVLAPWIDAPRLAKRLNDRNLPGVSFTPSAVPYPHNGKAWQGIRLHVTDPTVFLPSSTAIHIMSEIRRMHGNKLTFRRPRRGPYLFDLVWGTKDVRLALQRGTPAETIIKSWQPELERFKKLREQYLMYN